MLVQIKFKKLGNHWYPNISHEHLEHISLCRKAEKMLNVLSQNDEVTLTFIEQRMIVDQENLLQFDDYDITRFFTTNDRFLMNIYINDRCFQISSDLYALLEDIYGFDFHENLFKIEIW